MAEEQKNQERRKKVETKDKGTIRFSPAVPARVEEGVGRTGS